MGLPELTDETFATAVGALSTAVVIVRDPLCSTCGPYLETVKEVAQKIAAASFLTLSHDSAPTTLRDSGLSATPTTVIFRQGMLVHLTQGALAGPDLTALVDHFVAANVEELRRAVEEQGTTVIDPELHLEQHAER